MFSDFVVSVLQTRTNIKHELKPYMFPLYITYEQLKDHYMSYGITAWYSPVPPNNKQKHMLVHKLWFETMRNESNTNSKHLS